MINKKAYKLLQVCDLLLNRRTATWILYLLKICYLPAGSSVQCKTVAEVFKKTSLIIQEIKFSF